MENKFNTESFDKIEFDAEENARLRLAMIKKKRGGKYKLSEAQFIEEMRGAWSCGELVAAERILRCIELNPELENSVDLVKGEIHLFILKVFEVLKKSKNLEIKMDVHLEDLLWGKYSTEEVMKRREKFNVDAVKKRLEKLESPVSM